MTISEDELETLRRRARELAAARHSTRDLAMQSGGERHALFERRGCRYALDMRYVCGVARVLAPTPLPGAAAHWLGVASLHGELIAIVDLYALLLGETTGGEPRSGGSTESPTEADTQLILVVGREHREFGVAIDAVLDATRISETLARESHQTRSEELLRGITEDGTRVLRESALMIDPRLFLETSEQRET
jgi:chemotaxis signal transduction protein